jgi:hypothetical protein
MIAHDAGTHAGACSHRQTGCAGSQLGLLGLPRQRSHASCRATSCTPAGPAYDKIFTVVTGPVMVRPIGPDHPAVLGRYADHGRLLLRPASRGRAPACACALLICPGVRRVSRMRNLSPCSDSSFCCVFKDGQRCPSRLPQLVARRSGRRSGGSDTRSSSAMTSLHPSCHMCKNGVALCPPHSPICTFIFCDKTASSADQVYARPIPVFAGGFGSRTATHVCHRSPVAVSLLPACKNLAGMRCVHVCSMCVCAIAAACTICSGIFLHHVQTRVTMHHRVGIFQRPGPFRALGVWVKHQRSQFKAGNLLCTRLDKLNALGKSFCMFFTAVSLHGHSQAHTHNHAHVHIHRICLGRRQECALRKSGAGASGQGLLWTQGRRRWRHWRPPKEGGGACSNCARSGWGRACRGPGA